MTYHLRYLFHGRVVALVNQSFWTAKGNAPHMGPWWQIWAENENACWVIASSQSREIQECQ